jgi:hypothetical protein
LIHTEYEQVDFDVKEWERIPQYYEQDKEVLKVYRESKLAGSPGANDSIAAETTALPTTLPS